MTATSTILNMIFQKESTNTETRWWLKTLFETAEFERKFQQLHHKLSIPDIIKNQEFAEDLRPRDNRRVPGIT
jgi:hypothetical protein